ncbi:hypothetical protein DRP05_10920 [Archaeoglobales archaeon]|nr:MAG: hypothetical protein DRP05_10920 [Archaeoglobales archaeon]
MIPNEQYVYAKILHYCSIVTLLLLTLTFVVYVTGAISPYIPPEKLFEFLTYESDEIIKKTEMPIGWEWIGLVGYSDMLLYALLSFLALSTVLCYASILPILVKKKEKVYVIIALLEIIVLLFVSSGILQS